jgi:hypothetical protein
MTDDMKAIKAENDALRKRVETLQGELQGKFIDYMYEEKSDLDDLFLKILGTRPRNGGGAILRWELQREIMNELYQEKEGDLEQFISRLSMRKGLTKKKLNDGYILPLYELKMIKVFVGKDSKDKWRWNIEIHKEVGKK